jgi:hypothetical protein
MHLPGRAIRILITGLFVFGVSGNVAAAADPKIGVQLNKLETDGDDCRAHLVLENALGEALESFQLDMVVFDEEGIIHRRTAVELAPLREESTSVRAFRMPDTDCDGIGRILINEIAACEGPEGAIEGCFDRLQIESLADVPLIR